MFKKRRRELKTILETINDLECEVNSGNGKISNENIEEQISSFCEGLKEGKRKLITIFDKIFNAAFLTSSFDLKLNFYSEKITDTSSKTSRISSDVHSTAENTLNLITGITNANTALVKALENISLKANHLRNNTIESQKITQQISLNSQNALKYSNNMKVDFESLQSSLDRMKEIVGGIYEISDQTNLLAFNASIEAARAGEAGRSFSVVAEEIRKLSDTTKNLLSSISSIVNDIYTNSGKSSESIDHTVNSLKSISNSIANMLSSIESSNQDITEIASNLENISASSQEINASLEEITSTMSILNDKASDLNSYSEDLEIMGKRIDELFMDIEVLENTIDSTAKLCGEVIKNRIYGIPNEKFMEFIETAINNHKKWISQLESMVDTMEVKPLQTDEHKCSFGHFYYSVSPSNPEILDTWKKVDQHHRAVHNAGSIVIGYIKNNERSKALQAIEEARKSSEAMILLLTGLVEKTKTLTEMKQCVF
ncbi:MAG: CZB domain-containing protein [Firmicutes bacterium]|nr:CZB domain-containing protein [Bacillota bacterium]